MTGFSFILSHESLLETGVDLDGYLHKKRCPVSETESGFPDVVRQVWMGYEEIMSMYHAVLSCPHKDAASYMLYRTALEVVPIMFVQVKEIGC